MQHKKKSRVGMKLFSCLLATVLLLSGCRASDTKKQEEYTRELFAMGTYITLTAYGNGTETALELSEDKLTELESLWSVTNENSDIYKVNHSQGMKTTIQEETVEVLRFALQMAERTDGTVDPTVLPVITAWGFISRDYHVPSQEELEELLRQVDYTKVILEENSVSLPEGMQLDLGAFGKGYAGDILSELLKSEGVTSALLDIGGNIQMVGRKPEGDPWRLGIKNPFGEGSIGVLEAEDCAVVTSGNYERYFTDDGNVYGHIIDPSTGRPAESGLAAVTIIAEEGKYCDALSTSLYVMGVDDAIHFWQEQGNFDMLLITEDREIYVTDGIADDFTLADTYENMEIHVVEQ